MRIGRKLHRGLPITSFPLSLLALGSLLITASPAKAADFTLSDSAIMSLDYNMSNEEVQPFPPSILSEQDIPGTGVLFNVHFVSTNAPDAFLYRVSDKTYGAGTLAGINVSAYSNFDLQFTLVSVDGSSSATQWMEAASVIGPFNSYPYASHPALTSLTGDFPPSVVSTIAVTSATISVIGFDFNLYSYLDFGGWTAGPHNVTFLVQPAPEPCRSPNLRLGRWPYAALVFSSVVVVCVAAPHDPS